MEPTPNPVSPKVSAPVIAGAIISLVTLLATTVFGAEIEVTDATVALVTAAVTIVLGIVGYFRRDPLREV
jgi:uncharacterized membrane protein